MAIGSTSDTTGLRAAREQARLRQSLLNREYRQAKRSGNYMGALKATMLGEELGVKVGGTVRSEDVAAAGQAQYDEEMKRVGKIDAPTGLDAYKAMQPQARMSQQQSATPEAAEDLAAQFRDIYGKAKTEDERLAIVRDAKKVGVPLSKFGEKLLSDAGEQAQAPEEVAPKIRPPMTRMGPGGKTEFTEEGKKYYESLETSPRVANMVAESEGARLGRRLGEMYRSQIGALKANMKSSMAQSALWKQHVNENEARYNKKIDEIAPLEEEQARIRSTGMSLFAPKTPGLGAYVADPKLSQAFRPVSSKPTQSVPADELEYMQNKIEFDKKQAEEAKRQLELDRKIQEQRRLSLRPPTR